MSALDIQVGGGHYRKFTIQPCTLVMGMAGPAAHIVPYLVRTKGADDLDKAIHWCDLAIEHAMQGVVVVPIHFDSLPDAPVEAAINGISVTEWCWVNGIVARSNLAEALLALEVGDYYNAKLYIQRMQGSSDDEHEEMYNAK